MLLTDDPAFDECLRWRTKRKLSTNRAGPDYFNFYGHVEQLHQIIIPVNYTKSHWVSISNAAAMSILKDNRFNHSHHGCRL